MTYGDTQGTQLSLTGDLGALRQRLYERVVNKCGGAARSSPSTRYQTGPLRSDVISRDLAVKMDAWLPAPIKPPRARRPALASSGHPWPSGRAFGSLGLT